MLDSASRLLPRKQRLKPNGASREGTPAAEIGRSRHGTGFGGKLLIPPRGLIRLRKMKRNAKQACREMLERLARAAKIA